MKTILLATLAAFAIVAPVQAAAKSYKIVNVVVVSPTGKVPGAPSFKKGATIKIDVTKKMVTGPQSISIPFKKGSVTEDLYNEVDAKEAKSNTAVVSKSRGKITQIKLNFTRKALGNIPGQITYFLQPK
jgi:hypothetical protein